MHAVSFWRNLTPSRSYQPEHPLHTDPQECHANPFARDPVDQRAERFSMYALKAYMLPRLYWHGMLRGRA